MVSRANTDEKKFFGSGLEAKFPWYLDFDNPLARLGADGDFLGLGTDLFAEGRLAILGLLQEQAEAKDTPAEAAAKRLATLSGFAYNVTRLLFLDAAEYVEVEPTPELLRRQSETSGDRTPRLINQATSLHNSLRLTELVAAMFVKAPLPLTPQEVTADWTQADVAQCMPAELLQLAASDIRFTFDFDLRVPNIKLHAIRLVDLLKSECWLSILEFFSATGSLTTGAVTNFEMSCEDQDVEMMSCGIPSATGAVTHWVAPPTELAGLTTIFSDGLTAVVKIASEGVQYCDKTNLAAGDTAQCPVCPDWMVLSADLRTGEQVCAAAPGWISDECHTLRRVVTDFSAMMFGDLDAFRLSDDWLEPERSLPHNEWTRYLNLNNTFFTQTLAAEISETITGLAFDPIHVSDVLAEPISFPPDEDRLVLPGHGLNITLETLDLEIGPISSVHVLQTCPQSVECANYGFSLGASGEPAQHTLWHTASLESLKVGVGAGVTTIIKPGEEMCCVPNFRDTDADICLDEYIQTDHLQVNTTLSDVTAVVATLFAVNLTVFERLKLAPLLNQHAENAFMCALTGISSLSFSHLWVNVDGTAEPEITIAGLPLTSPASSVLAAGAGAAICVADPILQQVLPVMAANDCIEAVINDGAKWYLERVKSKCNTSAAPAMAELGFLTGFTSAVKVLNFTMLLAKEGTNHDYCDYATAANDILAEELDLESRQEKAGCPDQGFGCDLWSEIEMLVGKEVLPWERIRCAYQNAIEPDAVTGWPSVASGIVTNLDRRSLTPPVNVSSATVQFVVDEVTLSGLDHAFDVDLLKPVDNAFESKLRLGTPDVPLALTVNMSIGTSTGAFVRDLVVHTLGAGEAGFARLSQMATDQTEAALMSTHDFTLRLSAHNVLAAFNATVGLDLQRVVDMSLAQALNVVCWKSMTRDFGLSFMLDLGAFSASIDCEGDGCVCNAHGASIARSAAGCAIAGDCVWANGECKPDWLTGLKQLWEDPLADLRLKEGVEGLIQSFSNLINEDVIGTGAQVLNIRRCANDLYSIFGANEESAPVAAEERDRLLIHSEEQLLEETLKANPDADLLNLKENTIVQFVQPKLQELAADISSLVDMVAPGGNISIPVGISSHTFLPPTTEWDRETWLRKYNDGFDELIAMLEIEESQEWTLESVTLSGLDSLHDVQLLQSTEGNMTWLHSAKLAQVGVSLNITVTTETLQPPEEMNVWWSCVEEPRYEVSNLVITTRLKKITLEAATLLAVDLDVLLDDFELGRLLAEPLGCAISSVRDFQVNFVNVSLGPDCLLEPEFEVSGDPLPPMSTIIANMLRGAEALIEPLLQVHLPDALNVLLPILVTDQITEWRDENSECPPAPTVPADQDPWIDFLTNTNFQKLRDLIEKIPIDDINGWLGSLVEGMTTKNKVPCPNVLNGIPLNGDCSGVLIMMRVDVPGESILNLTTGGFDLEVSNVMISGLNTLHETLELIEPIAASRLNTTIAVGPVSASAHIVLRVQHGLDFGLDFPTMHDEFDISVGSEMIKFILGAIMKINTLHLWELTANELNLEDCWRGIMDESDLYEVALKFGLDPLQRLDLNVHCTSETRDPACESGVVLRLEQSLSLPESGSKLGASLNNILRAMGDSIVSGNGFNLPDSQCKHISGNTSIILDDVLGLGPPDLENEVPTKRYAAINENRFKMDPTRGGKNNCSSSPCKLVDLRCITENDCSVDGLRQVQGESGILATSTGGAGIVQLGLDMAQKAVNADLVGIINDLIEGSTCDTPPCFEQMIEVGPLVIRDTTQSLPAAVPDAAPFWIQESGEKWELTGVNLKSLQSVRNASVAIPLDVPGTQASPETYTLWNEVSMGEIVVELKLAVTTVTVAAPHTCVASESETDEVIITTGARDLHVGIATLLAIDEDALNALQAGQFFNNSLSCLLSSVHTLEITAANLSVGSLIKPTMTKQMNFGKLEHLVLDLLGPAICVAQPLLNMIARLAIGPTDGDINLREIINGWIMEQIHELASDCEPLSVDPPHFFDPYFNFQTAEVKVPMSGKVINIMKTVSKLVNQSVTPAMLNSVIRGDNGGTIRFQRSAAQIAEDSRDNTLCNKPCTVKELELCWGNWGDDGFEPSPYQPDSRTCSNETWEHGLTVQHPCAGGGCAVSATAPTGVGYEREMYTDSCGGRCSEDPNMFFEFFKRPQNSSVTGLKVPDNVGVLGEMVIEVANVMATGMDNAVQNVALLDITGPYSIANFAKIFQEAPVRLSMDIKIRISGMKNSLHSTEWPPLGLDTDFTVALSGQGIDVALEFVLQMTDQLRSLEVVDFFDEDCAIRIIQDMLPTLLELKIDEVGLDVTCRKCTPKLLEWEARTKSGPNLKEFTQQINALIEGYAELFEVEHDASGPLMHTAEDKRDSDELMRQIYENVLNQKQGISTDRYGDEVNAGVLAGDVQTQTSYVEACAGELYPISDLSIASMYINLSPPIAQGWSTGRQHWRT